MIKNKFFYFSLLGFLFIGIINKSLLLIILPIITSFLLYFYENESSSFEVRNNKNSFNLEKIINEFNINFKNNLNYIEKK